MKEELWLTVEVFLEEDLCLCNHEQCKHGSKADGNRPKLYHLVSQHRILGAVNSQIQILENHPVHVIQCTRCTLDYFNLFFL